MTAAQALLKRAFELYISNCNAMVLDSAISKVLSIGPLLAHLDLLYRSGNFAEFARSVNYFSYNLARGCDVEALVQYTLQSSGFPLSAPPKRIGNTPELEAPPE